MSAPFDPPWDPTAPEFPTIVRETTAIEPPFDCHEAVMAVLAAHTIECTDSSNGTVTCRCRSTVTEWMTWSDHRRHVANVLIANRLIVRDGV